MKSCVIKTHRGGGTGFINRECWWSLVWKPSVEHLCWDADDRLVRASESVDTVR